MGKIRGNLCNIYIVLWILYYLQEMLKIVGVIAQSILVVLMAISFYAFFLVNINYKTGAYLKWLDLLLLVLSIYGVVLFLSGFALYPDEFNSGTGLQFGYLQRIYTSVLPIYAFYYFSIKGELSETKLKYFFLIFLFFSILMYYQNFFVITKGAENVEITNNMGYRFVPLIPMLALFKMKDIWKYVFLTLIFAFIMMAMKRGAILVGTVAFVLFLKHHLIVKSVKHFLYLMLLSVVAISIIDLMVINLYETSDYFRTRFDSTIEGDTSNRSWMYIRYYDFFIHKTTGIEFLFGCGAESCYLKLGEFAHNDWLEFAINEGILGIVLYVVYWIAFIWEWKNYHGPLRFRQTLGDLIIIYFIISWFSMSFDGMPIVATLCIGYCLANSTIYSYISPQLSVDNENTSIDRLS